MYRIHSRMAALGTNNMVLSKVFQKIKMKFPPVMVTLLALFSLLHLVSGTTVVLTPDFTQVVSNGDLTIYMLFNLS